MGMICAPREDQVRRRLTVGMKDPSRGGTEGYPLSHRLLLIDLYQSGLPFPEKNRRSIQRWIKFGSDPKKKTGNKGSTSMLGEHLFFLALFKRIYPQATNPQCAVFIACYSDDSRVFTNTEITQGLRKLNMTRKKASTTAYQAFTKRNLYLYDCFRNFTFPAGVKDVFRRRLCDADEMALTIGDAGLAYGHAVKGLRVRKSGNYGRGRQKITIIMIIEPGDPALPSSVEGSIERPRIWYRVSTDKGTSTEAYKSFLDHHFLNQLRDDEPSRVMMHDNLSSHKSECIYQTMQRAGHNVICRPPYRPDIAPIEWAFDQLACSIRKRWYLIHNETDLIKQIRLVIDKRIGMGGFDKLFQNCKYLCDGEEEEEETDGEEGGEE